MEVRNTLPTMKLICKQLIYDVKRTLIIRVQLFFEQGESSNKQKMNTCFFQQIHSTNLSAKCELVFVSVQENSF